MWGRITSQLTGENWKLEQRTYGNESIQPSISFEKNLLSFFLEMFLLSDLKSIFPYATLHPDMSARRLQLQMPELKMIHFSFSYQKEENSLEPICHTFYWKIHKSKEFCPKNRFQGHETFSECHFIDKPKKIWKTTSNHHSLETNLAFAALTN